MGRFRYVAGIPIRPDVLLWQLSIFYQIVFDVEAYTPYLGVLVRFEVEMHILKQP